MDKFPTATLESRPMEGKSDN